MYEFFLVRTISDDDLLQARALLQGYCAMPESHQFYRTLFFRGPNQPNGLKKWKLDEKHPNYKSFQDLHQYLSKTSYILQVKYHVNASEFGTGSALMGDDKRQGTLRWSELPEPVKGDAVHFQRRMLEIPKQDSLPSTLGQNGHVLQSECVEESYSWYRENTEYTLRRDLRYPEDPLPGDPPAQTRPNASRAGLPPLLEMKPVGNRWVLQIRVLVPEARPELSNQAIGMLKTISDDLAGSFPYRWYDRRVFDTRIQATAGPTPPAVKVGGRT